VIVLMRHKIDVLRLCRSLRTVCLRRSMPCALLLCLLFAVPGLISAQSLQPGGPVDFGPIAVGSASSSVTLTFSASVTTTITSVAVTTDGVSSEDYTLVSQTCVGTLNPPQSCSITMSFSPKQIGLRKGALSILGSGGTLSNRVYLHGIGLGPQAVMAPVTSTATSSVAPLSPATFQSSAAVYDGGGNLYFNDFANGRILQLSSTGVYSVFATLSTTAQSSLALSGDGTLFVSSPTQGLVYEISQSGVISTLSTGTVTLVHPTGLAVDGLGYLYVADSQTSKIYRIALDGSGSVTLAMTGLSTPLSSPYGLALDSNYLYISDSGNDRIVKLSFSTALASPINTSGGLSNPAGITVDASGTIVVANQGGGNILQVSPSGTVYSFPIAAGNTPATTPLGVILRPNGDLLVSDATLGLSVISRSNPSYTFATTTKVGSFDSTDGYAGIITVQNTGNQALQLNTTPDPASSIGAFSIGPASTCPSLPAGSTPASLALGSVCTYAVGFTPTLIGVNTGTLNLNTTATGTGAILTTSATFTGTGITPVDTLKVTASPTVTAQGVPVSFTVSALQGTTVVPGFLGTVTFTATDPAVAFLSGASYTFTAADAGVHTFTAPVGVQFNTLGTFTVSAHFGTITGTSNTVLVQNTPVVTLTSSVNPAYVNQQTILTATVAPPTGSNAGTPTGSVKFEISGASLGTATLNNGQATLPLTLSNPGTYSITVVYVATANFLAATSAPLNQVVNAYTSETAISSSLNPAYVNQPLTFTASVQAAAGQGTTLVPTGNITFLYNGTNIGVGTLINGQASLPETLVASGNYTITGVYSGDTNFNGSSSFFTQTVEDFALALTPNTSGTATVVGGYPATYSFTVSPVGASTLLGPITFSLSGAPTGTTAAFSPATLAAGAGSTAVTLTVKPPPATQAHLDPAGPLHRNITRVAPIVLALLCLPLLGVRRRRPSSLLLGALLSLAAFGLTGCLSNSSSGYYGVTPQTYTLTVTASSGTLSHSTTVTLTVQ
jgi:sugar lactone lactonase YvrE